MRVFVYEHICGGGLSGRPLPESLAREGWAMLASIVEDFARVEGCEVVTTLDERLSNRKLPARHIVQVRGDNAPTFRRLASEADWTLVVAPEFDQVLFDRTRWVEEFGGWLLGPSSFGVSLTGDKLICERRLRQAGVPTVSSEIVPVEFLLDIEPDIRPPCVLKPRYGAGSQSIFLARDDESLCDIVHDWQAEGGPAEAMLQPFVRGLPASIALLVGPREIVPLAPVRQHLSDDGRFCYLGGELPLEAGLAERARSLGHRAVRAIPGLRGYVGVDLVLGEDAASDRVIEINPRLTTSYVGLRALACCNLAQLMVKVAAGEAMEPIPWRDGTISFWADGRVAYSQADRPEQEKTRWI